MSCDVSASVRPLGRFRHTIFSPFFDRHSASLSYFGQPFPLPWYEHETVQLTSPFRGRLSRIELDEIISTTTAFSTMILHVAALSAIMYLWGKVIVANSIKYSTAMTRKQQF